MHQTIASPRPDTSAPLSPAPHDTAGWPAILVMESQPVLSATLAELFEALHIRMVTVRAGAALERALWRHQPLGVLAHLPPGEADVTDSLGCVARHDATLPVMVVTDPPANAVRAAGDSGARPLVNMVWLPRPPALKMVIEFLSMAERRLARPD